MVLPPKPPCRKCHVIRLFLLSVAIIASIGTLRPGLFTVLGNLSPLTFSLVFVGVLATLAAMRHLIDYLSGK